MYRIALSVSPASFQFPLPSLLVWACRLHTTITIRQPPLRFTDGPMSTSVLSIGRKPVEGTLRARHGGHAMDNVPAIPPGLMMVPVWQAR